MWNAAVHPSNQSVSQSLTLNQSSIAIEMNVVLVVDKQASELWPYTKQDSCRGVVVAALLPPSTSTTLQILSITNISSCII
jgi:hypothetical protein